ncbi:hypothetical protein KAR91_57355 [Candidatus Pacearchaeota archaeon]|nr:hypothetical protein [Candidatus Pacearchaeota archaeon]
MAYKTNPVIMAELDLLSIGYDDDMTNDVLRKLLDDALEAQGKTDKPEAKKEPQAQAPEVTNGVATANDHEKRIFAIEHGSVLSGDGDAGDDHEERIAELEQSLATANESISKLDQTIIDLVNRISALEQPTE